MRKNIEIEQYDSDGKVIATFDSIAQAARDLNLSIYRIRQICDEELNFHGICVRYKKKLEGDSQNDED